MPAEFGTQAHGEPRGGKRGRLERGVAVPLSILPDGGASLENEVERGVDPVEPLRELELDGAVRWPRGDDLLAEIILSHGLLELALPDVLDHE